ncbi:MAG: hypothetical protein O2975_09715 [Proteobacteria bacterium]|nr:hypothetical protein [Pseudomonadota bacterium]
MDAGNETLRFPTHLDHEAIVARLIKVRDEARSTGVVFLADQFTDPGSMSPGQIGAAVVASLGWVQEKDEYRSLAAQLEIVAMNLKNLGKPKPA